MYASIKHGKPHEAIFHNIQNNRCIERMSVNAWSYLVTLNDNSDKLEKSANIS